MFPVRAAAVVCAVAVAVPVVTGCGSERADSVVSAAEATQDASATPSAAASLSSERAQRRTLVESAKIGWDKAATTATGEVPQSELVELDLGRGSSSTDPSHDTDATNDTNTASPSASPGPGTPQWTATVALKDGTAHQVTIDAVTGKVLSSRLEQGQDTGDKQELAGLLAQATLTPQQAAATATEKHPGTVTGLQLDGGDDSGNDVVWETEVANTGDWTEADIEIDAVSGKILRERIDQD